MLPLFFMESTNQAHIPYWLFVIPVVPLTVMITWIYNNTNGSIFAVALFHTMGNMSHEIFKVSPTSESPSLLGFVILGVVYTIAATIIVLIYGHDTLVMSDRHLSRRQKARPTMDDAGCFCIAAFSPLWYPDAGID